MSAKYKTEISKLIAKSWGWAVEESVKADKKLSQDEILQLVSRDCARGADGKPVMHSVPRKIKL